MEAQLRQLGFEEIPQRPVFPAEKIVEYPAQIAFIDTLLDSFSIKSGNRRISGFGIDKMPVVDCPIIDVSTMSEFRIDKICFRFGIIYDDKDIPRIIAEYLKYGGKLVTKGEENVAKL